MKDSVYSDDGQNPLDISVEIEDDHQNQLKKPKNTFISPNEFQNLNGSKLSVYKGGIYKLPSNQIK